MHDASILGGDAPPKNNCYPYNVCLFQGEGLDCVLMLLPIGLVARKISSLRICSRPKGLFNLSCVNKRISWKVLDLVSI